MDEKRPSRRKDKDNPYTMIVKDGKFFVMFRNIDNESVMVECRCSDRLTQNSSVEMARNSPGLWQGELQQNGRNTAE